MCFSLRLYYDHGECIALRMSSSLHDETQEIVERLVTVTTGSETMEMSLRRNNIGQLGFHLHHEGVVTDVEHQGMCSIQRL